MNHRSYPMVLLAGLFLFILMLSLAGCVENMNSAGRPKNSADIIKPETEYTASDSWSRKQKDGGDTFGVPQDSETPGPSSPGLNVGSHFNFDALDADKDNTKDASVPTEDTSAPIEKDATEENATETETASGDASGTASGQDINSPEAEPEPPTKAPLTASYATMEYGFAFDYPLSWKKVQDDGGEVVFSVEKIAHKDTTDAPDRATITVTYFEQWTSDFPVGSEKINVNGQDIMLVDLDTDGPSGRDYYRKIGKSSALKMSMMFEPGYRIQLETESAGWKDYLDASEKIRKEVFQQYLDMILSVTEDV